MHWMLLHTLQGGAKGLSPGSIIHQHLSEMRWGSLHRPLWLAWGGGSSRIQEGVSIQCPIIMKEKTKWVHESQRNPVTMQSSVEGCVLEKTRALSSTPTTGGICRLFRRSWGEKVGRGYWVLNVTFLSSYQMLLVVLAHGPHFEKQVSPLLMLFCLFASSLYYKQEHEYW